MFNDSLFGRVYSIYGKVYKSFFLVGIESFLAVDWKKVFWMGFFVVKVNYFDENYNVKYFVV